MGVSLAGAVHAGSTGPRLAAYYEYAMAICGGRALSWSGNGTPRALMAGIRQVGVGKKNRYALNREGVLFGWEGDAEEPVRILQNVASFHADALGLRVYSEHIVSGRAGVAARPWVR